MLCHKLMPMGLQWPHPCYALHYSNLACSVTSSCQWACNGPILAIPIQHDLPHQKLPCLSLYRLSLINLWYKVKLHESVVCILQLVLHRERRVRAETKLHCAAERRGLGESHQIAERKSCSNRFVHSQTHLLFRLLRFSRLHHDIPGANVALHTKTDAFLARLDLHGLTEFLQIPADLLELSRWQSRKHLVLLFRNLHMFTLDLHQLEVKISNPVVFATFALEAHSVRIILPPQLQGVARTAHLEDLPKRVHVHAE